MRFSHIYVEHRARGYPLTDRIIARFRDATIVEMGNYKRLFNRPRQDFRAQQRSAKLILAVKRSPFVYPVSENCQTFGFARSVYTTPMLGCPFDCDYCYLHGMLSSANLVLFVNLPDFFDAVTALGRTSKDPVQVSLTYGTDILPLEGDFGLCREWIRFVRGREGLVLEIRTKSAAYDALEGVRPARNVTLAWSLSPDAVVRRYEHRTPSLRRRLEAMGAAAGDGWSLRPCFDPVIPVEGWEAMYGDLFARTFEAIPPGAAAQVAVGSLRLGDTHLKRMRAARPRCDLFHRPLRLPEAALETVVAKTLYQHIEKEKVELWKPPS